MSSKIVVREATLADYDAVMDIDHNIYSGWDYLFSKYVEYCHDPDTYLFVAEYEGTLVSYIWHTYCIWFGLF